MRRLSEGIGRAVSAGVEIAYFVEGRGPAIVGTHPYWSPKRGGYPAIPGFTTITVFPRGFRESAPARDRSDYGFWRLADDLDAVRRHLGLDKWVYWGVSYGGMAGQVYALKYPQTLHGLILDGTAPSWHYIQDPNSIWPQVTRSPEAAAFRTDPTPETQRAFQDLIGRLGMNEWGFPTDGMIEQEQNAAALAECVRRIGEYDVREELKGLEIPVLILVGEMDPSCPPSQAQRIADAVPNGDLHVFHGIGHGVRFHNPPGLLEVVTKFVRDAIGDA
jgi:pimeloyl-ACP methyl ester carboxylesterase